MRRLGPFLLCLGLAATGAGCSARRTALPPAPGDVTARQDLRRVNVYVRGFTVEGLGPRDTRRNVRELEERFLDYLEAHLRLSTIYLDRTARPVAPALGLDVAVRLEHTTHRTFILDVVALVPYVFGLVTPTWGRADVDVTARVSGPD